MLPGHEVEIISLDAGRAAGLDRLFFFGQELHPQGGDDRLGDLVLDREDVGKVAVVAVGPGVTAGLGVDQLGGDPHPVAGLAHAAFEDVGDVERARDFLDVHHLALERERRVPRDHEQRRDLRQIGDDVLGNAVAEIFLLRVAAHVDERKHADRHALRLFRVGVRGNARGGLVARGLRNCLEQISKIVGQLDRMELTKAQRRTASIEAHWNQPAAVPPFGRFVLNPGGTRPMPPTTKPRPPRRS